MVILIMEHLLMISQMEKEPIILQMEKDIKVFFKMENLKVTEFL